MSGYSKPRSGQSIGSGPARSALFYSDAMDLIDSFKRGGAPPGQQNGDNRGPIIFIRNDTGADLKLGQVVELGDYLLDEENPFKWWYEGLAVSTTFRRRYALAAEPIPDGTIGAAWVRGPAVLRYAGSAPASGDGFGPKPSTVTLEPGYPCLAIVDDVIDATEKLAGCTLGEIGEIFGKPQADIAAATDATTPSTGAVIAQYFDGTSYQATTLELTGTNVLKYKLMAGRLFKWVAVGDQWCAVELASRVWEGSIAATVSAGASGTVTLSDGTSHTGKNVSGSDLEAGAVFAGDDAYGGGLIFTAGGGDGTRKFWKCTLVDEIGPTATGTISLSDTSIGTGGAVEATNRSNSDPGMPGALGFAWKDIDDAYYFVADGLRWFTATLSADLAAADLTAAVDNVVCISGGSVPGSLTDVDNQLELSGSEDDTVFFVESPNAGSEKYYLVAVTSRVNKPRWFKAKLNGALEPEDVMATIDTVAALDGGSAPAVTSIKNPHARRGLDNADCLFVEDWDDLDEEDNPTYILADMREEGPYLCKTDGAIGKASSGSCSIWTGTPGSESDSGANVTAYNRFADVGSGKWVWVAWNGHGFYLIAAECPLT